MRIRALRTVCVDLPLEEPARTAIHDIRSLGCVLVFLDTEAGATGESYLFAPGGAGLGRLAGAVHALAPRILGADARDPETLWRDLWRGLAGFGAPDPALLAVAAVDTACWDAAGKAAGRALVDRLGCRRARVPVYASGGLWLSADIDALVAQAEGFLAAGFRAIKLRVGKPALEEDAERVGAVRAAVGPEIAIMVDANQGLARDHAIALGRRLQDYGVAWFEEPLPAADLDGAAAVAAALELPLAAGENAGTRYGFRELIRARAARVLMPDLQRVGGVSELLRAAQLAQAAELAISPHLFTEHSLQLAGALANATYVEHMPWFAPLFRESLTVVEGTVEVPRRPGFGFTFDLDAVERLRVEPS